MGHYYVPLPWWLKRWVIGPDNICTEHWTLMTCSFLQQGWISSCPAFLFGKKRKQQQKKPKQSGAAIVHNGDKCFQQNVEHTELFALARTALYKVCNDWPCPMHVEHAFFQLLTPSLSTDVFFHILSCWVFASVLHLWGISEKPILLISCNLGDLCTSEATDRVNSNLLFPPTSAPDFFFPPSTSDCQIFWLW